MSMINMDTLSTAKGPILGPVVAQPWTWCPWCMDVTFHVQLGVGWKCNQCQCREADGREESEA